MERSSGFGKGLVPAELSGRDPPREPRELSSTSSEIDRADLGTSVVQSTPTVLGPMQRKRRTASSAVA
jgi:hypothetical protein